MTEERNAFYGKGARVGNYTILETLGTGSLGAVYLAQHCMLKKQVALKAILPAWARESEWREKFIRDAVVSARFQHPCIAQVLDMGEHDGAPYYTMEIIEGAPLSNLVQSGRVPSLPALLTIMAKIAGALQHTHDRGYVHRDVRPSTIMVRPSNEPVLVDFGRAIQPSESSGETQSPQFAPEYAAPELIRNDQVIDGRVDVYGIGATLYSVLANRPVTESQERQEACEEIRSSAPIDISPLKGKAPDAVIAIVGKCLKKIPEDRYETADALRRTLESVADHLKASETAGPVTLPVPGRILMLNVNADADGVPDSVQEYEIRRYIGGGQFGDVYHARSVFDKHDVALKVMKPQWVEDEDTRARFRREALILSRLSHENVVRVYHSGRYDSTLFISMELLEGTTLQALMRLAGAMSPARAARLVVPVLRGLAAVHDAGTIHRDIKPGNVMVAGSRVVICDFGIARSEDTVTLTMPGMFVGTPAYAAPEHVLGKPLTPAADVFAVGVMLYEMLSTRRPHKDALVERRDGKPITPIEKYRHGLPRTMIELLCGLLDNDPSRRPTATEAADALGPFADADDATVPA